MCWCVEALSHKEHSMRRFNQPPLLIILNIGGMAMVCGEIMFVLIHKPILQLQFRDLLGLEFPHSIQNTTRSWIFLIISVVSGAWLAHRKNRGLVGITPFPGQSNGWMWDILHEERYICRCYHHELSFLTTGDA